jgi:membrane-associated phospholipid phosphatase
VSGPREATVLAERLLVGYASAAALLAALAPRLEAQRAPLVAGHLAVGLAALLLALADRRGRGPGFGWLRRWFPVIALLWLYGAAGELRHAIVPRDLDAVVSGWDAALFPGRWYLAGSRLPAAALEAAHLVYFSYYPLLFVPALLAERRARREVDLFLFALTLTLLAHYALDVALPVSGPLEARAAALPPGHAFVPLVDALYARFDRGGLAFPSTHVAAGLVAAWFAGRRFFPRRTAWYAVWFALVAASTVLCGFHYPVDVLAGLVTGAGCLAAALRIAGATDGAAPPARPRPARR